MALEFLQDHAAFTRRGHAGAVQADTDGYAAAAFTHRTSRARDPQLHTHVLVSAKVRASTDGTWLALDGRELFEVQKAAGLVYKAGLRSELRTRLGVAWGTVEANGGAEVVGVPPGLVEHFSKRRAQVEARANELIAAKETALGRSLNAAEQAAAFQLAAYQSRAAKAKGQETTSQLRARWRREAGDCGHQPDEWVRAVLGQLSAAPRTGNGARLKVLVLRWKRWRARSFWPSSGATPRWGRADVVEALGGVLRPAPPLVPRRCGSWSSGRQMSSSATPTSSGLAQGFTPWSPS